MSAQDDQEAKDFADLIAHNTCMSILTLIGEQPGNSAAPCLSGTLMAAAVTARIQYTGAPGGRGLQEYQQRKAFLAAAGDLFDKSLTFIREYMEIAAKAGHPITEPSVVAAANPINVPEDPTASKN